MLDLKVKEGHGKYIVEVAVLYEVPFMPGISDEKALRLWFSFRPDPGVAGRYEDFEVKAGVGRGVFVIVLTAGPDNSLHEVVMSATKAAEEVKRMMEQAAKRMNEILAVVREMAM